MAGDGDGLWQTCDHVRNSNTSHLYCVHHLPLSVTALPSLARHTVVRPCDISPVELSDRQHWAFIATVVLRTD